MKPQVYSQKINSDGDTTNDEDDVQTCSENESEPYWDYFDLDVNFPKYPDYNANYYDIQDIFDIDKYYDDENEVLLEKHNCNDIFLEGHDAVEAVVAKQQNEYEVLAGMAEDYEVNEAPLEKYENEEVLLKKYKEENEAPLEKYDYDDEVFLETHTGKGLLEEKDTDYDATVLETNGEVEGEELFEVNDALDGEAYFENDYYDDLHYGCHDDGEYDCWSSQ